MFLPRQKNDVMGDFFPQPQKYETKQILGAIIGPVIAAGLAKALGAPDEFAAQMARGGMSIGGTMIERNFQNEERLKELRDKIATELVILGIKRQAEREKDEKERMKKLLFAKKLDQIRKLATKADGSFDPQTFAIEAAKASYELGLDPDKDLLKVISTAQKATNKILPKTPFKESEIYLGPGGKYYRDRWVWDQKTKTWKKETVEVPRQTRPEPYMLNILENPELYRKYLWLKSLPSIVSLGRAGIYRKEDIPEALNISREAFREGILLPLLGQERRTVKKAIKRSQKQRSVFDLFDIKR